MAAERMNTAQALVEGLVANGLDTLYALPGVQNDPFFDALYHAQNRLRVIHTRHEQGSGYMALGAAMATGRPQGMAVVPGPGLLNASTALATAYSNNARVLAISGQIPLQTIGRGTGQLHEIVGQTEILRTLTKWTALVKAPGDVAPLVEQAFAQLLSGRPRPVGLEVPMDVWQRAAAVHPHRAAVPPPPPPVDEDAAEEAAKLLGQAERPMIVAGGGALEAGAELLALAEALSAPVMTFRMGRGVIGTHPLDVRLPVGHRLWKDADVVLLVGTRGQNPLGTWGTTGLKILRVDIDPEEATRVNRPDLFLHGEAKPVLAAIAARVGKHNRARAERLEAIAEAKAAVMSKVEATLAPQVGFLQAIREELPADGIFVDELTQVGYVSRIWLPVPAPRRFLSTGLQGTLGWGFATALGAKAACPDRPVLVVNGDGGFMFTVQEMATAVQHRLGVVALVFNDGAFGNVRTFQRQNFGGRLIASELRNPDFVKLAESFGAQGLRATTPEELRAALRRGFASTEVPTLIEIPVGELPSPWEFIMLPKVR